MVSKENKSCSNKEPSTQLPAIKSAQKADGSRRFKLLDIIAIGKAGGSEHSVAPPVKLTMALAKTVSQSRRMLVLRISLINTAYK